MSSVIGRKKAPQEDAQEEAQEDVEADPLAAATAGQVAEGHATQGFGRITFLSDYGLSDEYVAVCKAVIARIAPHATILDITHNIRPYAISEAANVLTRAVRYIPESVHLAVVDPGVGSRRRGVAVRTAEGSVLVGPDNGLFPPVAAELGGLAECRELTNRQLMLEDVSSTFHGRDVFAPVAAHLAGGVDVSEVGPAIDPGVLVRLGEVGARLHDDHLHAEVIHIDVFGNLQTSARASLLIEAGIAPGTPCEVRFSYLWVTAPYEKTFSSVDEGGWVLTEDSSGSLSLSINRGNAALTLKAEVGDQLSIGRAGFECVGEPAGQWTIS